MFSVWGLTVRRIEPAYPDLLPVTHLVRPGYLPGPRVALDPIRMGIVWDDAPQRILPAEGSVPRDPVRAIVFARVARDRNDVLHRLLDRGSSALLVLDDPKITPRDLGISTLSDDLRLTVLLPVLPFPLSNGLRLPSSWKTSRWGAVLGLFPFPGAAEEVVRRIDQLDGAGARFAVAAPLLLTPKDRHRILDAMWRADCTPSRGWPEYDSTRWGWTPLFRAWSPTATMPTRFGRPPSSDCGPADWINPTRSRPGVGG